MSSISMDQREFFDGLKDWKTAMGKVEKSSKENVMKLEAKGSDAQFITNYIKAVTQTREALQAYYKLLKKDYDCMVAVRETMQLADEAASEALQKN